MPISEVLTNIVESEKGTSGSGIILLLLSSSVCFIVTLSWHPICRISARSGDFDMSAELITLGIVVFAAILRLNELFLLLLHHSVLCETLFLLLSESVSRICN